MRNQLERLHESLLRNAEWFRKNGHKDCAYESESIAARLRAAIDQEASTCLTDSSSPPATTATSSTANPSLA